MREDWQAWERKMLAPWAALSEKSQGRARYEPECPMRTIYQRDRDRVIHTKAFRRLMHKAQVFLNPKSDHFRTRLTHTLELSQISRTIARALSLNEDLTEAIALAHDLGHTPFGHAGERALAELVPGFTHNRQGLRIVDCLEHNNQGLNLSFEVRDGILYHSGEGKPATLEGMTVRVCDRIAYLNHDIDDALRAGLISSDYLPEAARFFGMSQSQRINAMVLDVITNSLDKPLVAMSENAAQVLGELREFMFKHVYFHPDKIAEEAKVREMIHDFFEYYIKHFDQLPEEYRQYQQEQAVADYISGMTDSFAVEHYRTIFPDRQQPF